ARAEHQKQSPKAFPLLSHFLFPPSQNFSINKRYSYFTISPYDYQEISGNLTPGTSSPSHLSSQSSVYSNVLLFPGKWSPCLPLPPCSKPPPRHPSGKGGFPARPRRFSF